LLRPIVDLSLACDLLPRLLSRLCMATSTRQGSKTNTDTEREARRLRTYEKFLGPYQLGACTVVPVYELHAHWHGPAEYKAF
jgi:hypothetical protein